MPTVLTGDQKTGRTRRIHFDGTFDCFGGYFVVAILGPILADTQRYGTSPGAFLLNGPNYLQWNNASHYVSGTLGGNSLNVISPGPPFGNYHAVNTQVEYSGSYNGYLDLEEYVSWNSSTSTISFYEKPQLGGNYYLASSWSTGTGSLTLTGVISSTDLAHIGNYGNAYYADAAVGLYQNYSIADVVALNNFSSTTTVTMSGDLCYAKVTANFMGQPVYDVDFDSGDVIDGIQTGVWGTYLGGPNDFTPNTGDYGHHIINSGGQLSIKGVGPGAFLGSANSNGALVGDGFSKPPVGKAVQALIKLQPHYNFTGKVFLPNGDPFTGSIPATINALDNTQETLTTAGSILNYTKSPPIYSASAWGAAFNAASGGLLPTSIYPAGFSYMQFIGGTAIHTAATPHPGIKASTSAGAFGIRIPPITDNTFSISQAPSTVVDPNNTLTGWSTKVTISPTNGITINLNNPTGSTSLPNIDPALPQNSYVRKSYSSGLNVSTYRYLHLPLTLFGQDSADIVLHLAGPTITDRDKWYKVSLKRGANDVEIDLCGGDYFQAIGGHLVSYDENPLDANQTQANPIMQGYNSITLLEIDFVKQTSGTINVGAFSLVRHSSPRLTTGNTGSFEIDGRRVVWSTTTPGPGQTIATSPPTTLPWWGFGTRGGDGGIILGMGGFANLWIDRAVADDFLTTFDVQASALAFVAYPGAGDCMLSGAYGSSTPIFGCLVIGSSFSGLVLDKYGKPLKNKLVTITDQGNPANVATAHTDATGYYKGAALWTGNATSINLNTARAVTIIPKLGTSLSYLLKPQNINPLFYYPRISFRGVAHDPTTGKGVASCFSPEGLHHVAIAEDDGLHVNTYNLLANKTNIDLLVAPWPTDTTVYSVGIAWNPSGHVIAMWCIDEGGTGKIYKSISPDFGQTWGPIVMIGQGYVSAAYDIDPTTGVEYCLANDGANWVVLSRTDKDATWTNVGTVVSYPPVQASIRVASSKEHRIVAVFIDGSQNIQKFASTNRGVTWGQE